MVKSRNLRIMGPDPTYNTCDERLGVNQMHLKQIHTPSET